MTGLSSLGRTVFAAWAAFTITAGGLANEARPDTDAKAGDILFAPVLAAAPRLDQVATNARPLMSWANADGGVGAKTYILQLDKAPSFDSEALREYAGIESGIHITSFRLPDPLDDDTQYFWRVMATDEAGNRSAWGREIGDITARFFVRTAWDDQYYGPRVPVESITTSPGTGVEYIQDYDESGLSAWTGEADRESHWVQFDFGEPATISRIWLLFKEPGWKPREQSGYTFVTRQTDLAGRATDYQWMYSDDGVEWSTVPGTRMEGADGFRAEFMLDDNPIAARYLKLDISGWMGDAPKVAEATFYRRGAAPVPDVPDGPYVMVIGNSRSDSGNSGTSFRDVVLGLDGHVAPTFELEVVEVSHYDISQEVVDNLPNKPLAIFLTGFGRWDEMIPQFEFNGEYEIIRESNIPILGACGGLQLMAQQDGFTFAVDTGRYFGTSSLQAILEEDIPPVDIHAHDDPFFSGMVTPFFGPKFHSWAVSVVPEGWEILATSTDSDGVVVNEVMRASDRLVYGTQFHPEIAQSFSTSKVVLNNFLSMAIERYREQTQ